MRGVGVSMKVPTMTRSKLGRNENCEVIVKGVGRWWWECGNAGG